MIDLTLARLRAHRNNVQRYRRLLGTRLSGCEREYIERRLTEETASLEALAQDSFPLMIPSSPSAMGLQEHHHV